MDEKRKTIHARSKENGVVFYSNKFPDLCYEAYTAEDGAVQTEFYPSIVSRMDTTSYGGMLLPKDLDKGEKHLLLIKVLISIVGILSIILSHNISIAFALIYFWILVLKDAVTLTAISWQIKHGNLKTAGRYHAAEHQVINAYEKFKRIPTMDEVKNTSMFSKQCPSRSMISKITYFTLLSIVIALSAFVSTYVYIILFGLLILSIVLENKLNHFRFLQMLLMNKPTEAELKVALEGLKFFEHMEENMPEECVPMGMIIIEAYIGDSEEGDEGAETEAADNETTK